MMLMIFLLVLYDINLLLRKDVTGLKQPNCVSEHRQVTAAAWKLLSGMV